jgi:RimJ/RimL family protein N-acetyltransferase
MMAGFFGSEAQRELQSRTYELRDWIAATPGLYNAGRFYGVDDPDRLPWETLEELLKRDGILGFRMISPAQAERYFPKVEDLGCRIDRWDIFVGAASDVDAASSAILARGLPAGLRIASALVGPETDDTRRLQQFCADNGLAPFPGAMLASAAPLAATTVIEDEAGRVIAAGHAYFPHNDYSPFRRHAWVGLVSVAANARGKGLGAFVNALLVQAAISDLGASHVYEMVAPDNPASRRMIESCGLTLRPELLCGVGVPSRAQRFTR